MSHTVEIIEQNTDPQDSAEAASASSSWSARHLDWLVDTGHTITTTDGRTVQVFEFSPQDEPAMLSNWAKHFRNHYCLDTEIDALRDGTGLSRADYLICRKFPSQSTAPGPSIRAGDFGEILVADYLEYRLGYWVPRTRYDHKSIRNESTKGSDVLGFKLGENESLDDTMTIAEVKTQFSGQTAEPRLQDAITDSIKDEIRKGESLNAIKQRMLDKSQRIEAGKIARFQNPVDKPYKELPAAVALFSLTVYDEEVIKATSAEAHPAKDSLILITIRGNDFMPLVHELYKRAADEA